MSTEYKKTSSHFGVCGKEVGAENNYEKYDSNRPQTHQQQTNR